MSLLEAMVVLAVVGLVGSLGYPRLDQAYHLLRLRTATQGLSNDLHRSRAAALLTDRPAGLRRGGGGTGYVLSDGTLRVLPEGAILQTTGDIRFYPDGTASGGRWRIEADGYRMEVFVEPATGAIWRRTR
jgi:type II secretory pathway pseudopilin PulG